MILKVNNVNIFLQFKLFHQFYFIYFTNYLSFHYLYLYYCIIIARKILEIISKYIILKNFYDDLKILKYYAKLNSILENYSFIAHNIATLENKNNN